MVKGGSLRYILTALMPGLFLLPFLQEGGTALAQRNPEGDAEVRNGLVYGHNPNRREPRDNDPILEVRFVPDSIAIGDVFNLEVDVTRDILQIVGLPEFEEGIIGDIFEIVDVTPEDTIARDGRKVTLRTTYTLQTFEDGILNIGWFPALYIDKNITDTIWSVDSLVLKVGTFQIDTLTQTIHDIRGIMPTPVRIGEFSGYTAIALAVLAVIALCVWYYITRRRNLTMLGKPKVIDPPHVAAIKALEALHNQKLWQNNRHKQYYTGITDILRTYLENRYFIPAMEMTSEEILGGLRDRELPEKSYAGLTSILRTADLVKFAKYVPDPETNENTYTDAYYFVEQTKPFEIEKPEPQEGVTI